MTIGLLSQGRWAEVETPLAEGEALALRHGHVWSQFLLLMSRGWLGLSRPDAVDAFERSADQLARFADSSGFRLSFPRSHVCLGLAAWWRGRLEEAPAHFEAGVRAQLPVIFNDEAWAASLLFRARTGDVSEASPRRTTEFLRPPEGVDLPASVWVPLCDRQALVVLGQFGEAAQFPRRWRPTTAAARCCDGWTGACIRRCWP